MELERQHLGQKGASGQHMTAKEKWDRMEHPKHPDDFRLSLTLYELRTIPEAASLVASYDKVKTETSEYLADHPELRHCDCAECRQRAADKDKQKGRHL